MILFAVKYIRIYTNLPTQISEPNLNCLHEDQLIIKY